MTEALGASPRDPLRKALAMTEGRDFVGALDAENRAKTISLTREQVLTYAWWQGL